MVVDEISPPEAIALPIDPLAGRRGWASRIEGLGGTEEPGDPGYVFCTISVRPAIGPAKVAVRFHNLRATKGTLLVEVVGVSLFPGAEMTRVKTLSVDMADIASSGGFFEVAFESRRNTLYAVYGAINDETDAAADAIAAELDRPWIDGDLPWNWTSNASETRSRTDDLVTSSLTSLARPTFDSPVSQLATPLQLRSAAFAKWMNELKIGPDTDVLSAFGSAFVLQALSVFGAFRPGMGGLGFGSRARRLPSFFSANKIQTLTVLNIGDSAAFDQGEMLEKLWVEELCEEKCFFEHAHLTASYLPSYPASLTSWFDFVWSVGLNREIDKREFECFVSDSLSCLKPGGVAVHVFDYGDGSDEQPSFSMDRAAIERMIVRCLARQDNAAVLKFRPHEIMGSLARPYPFGIILRRSVR